MSDLFRLWRKPWHEKRGHPAPYLREKNGEFKLRWTETTGGKKEYQITLGVIPREKAESIRASLAEAFAYRRPFPPELQDNPVVKKWAKSILGIPADQPDHVLIEKYVAYKFAICTSAWPRTLKMHLTNALEYIGTLKSAHPVQLNDFLTKVHVTTTAATRNRAHASLSGFYRWLGKVGYSPQFFLIQCAI